MPLGLFTRPLKLALGAQTLVARSPADLDVGLHGRASISPGRADALGALPDAALQGEIDALRVQEQRMIRALAGDGGRRNGLDPLFAEIDLAQVTEDQDWRTILTALRDAGPLGRDYHRVVVGHYLAYVGAARDLMRALLAGRSGARLPPDDADERALDLGPRQTLLFDLAALADGADGGASGPDGEFNRMPKGDTVTIELRPHQSLSLLLAKHPFTLVAGTPWLLVDEHGNDIKLPAGKCVVGRSQQADIGLDPVFRAISRRHLVLEIGDGATVHLTDISTLGTFVPRAYLDNRLH